MTSRYHSKVNRNGSVVAIQNQSLFLCVCMEFFTSGERVAIRCSGSGDIIIRHSVSYENLFLYFTLYLIIKRL